MNTKTSRFLSPVALVFLLVALPLLGSCTEDDYVTDPREDLVFSADTVSFDTVFSGVGSTTAWLMVRNTGSKPALIQSVSLQSGGASGFRLNLDGEPGVSFSDVVIPAKDSLYLFVELTAAETGETGPVQFNDAVVFQTDGPVRRIELEAWSWDADVLKGVVFTSDTLICGTKPILVYDSLVVAANATLTLAPGTRLHFHDGAYMKVSGRLLAEGTASQPIVLRGDRLDYVLDLPYDAYPGQWYYLQFTSESYGNKLDFVDLHGAYYGIVNDSSDLSRTKLTLTHSTIHNMVNSCLYNIHSNIEVRNTQLSNSGSFTVALIGGKSTFIHCTIANYEPSWMVNREAPALGVLNYVLDNAKNPIGYPLEARFHNTIVFGSQSNEVYLADTSLYSWDLTFERCMLRSPVLPSEMGTIVNCIYPSQPKFMHLGTEAEHYVFDFRLDSISPAVDYGDPAFLNVCPLDRDGLPRDARPDIGAYEWKSVGE